MIGPDGTVHPNESRFEHIEPDRRVVIQHTCTPFFRLAITLDPTGDGTTLHWDQTFADAALTHAKSRDFRQMAGLGKVITPFGKLDASSSQVIL